MAPSVFTSSEKSLVKSVFPSSSYTILTVTPARVYAAYPSPDRWNSPGIEGALALVRDSSTCFFFKVLNLKVCHDNSYLEEKGKIVWDHELSEDFYFYEDKSYFHTFAGDVCIRAIDMTGMHDRFLLCRRIWCCTNVQKSEPTSEIWYVPTPA